MGDGRQAAFAFRALHHLIRLCHQTGHGGIRRLFGKGAAGGGLLDRCRDRLFGGGGHGGRRFCPRGLGCGARRDLGAQGGQCGLKIGLGLR